MGPSVKHVFGVLEWFYMLNAKILFQNRTLAKDNFFIFLKILPTITSKNLPFLPWILFQHLSQPCGSCCKNIFKQRWIFLVKIKSRSHLLCWTKMARVYLGGSTVHTLNWQAKVTEQPIIRGYYISPGFIKKTHKSSSGTCFLDPRYFRWDDKVLNFSGQFSMGHVNMWHDCRLRWRVLKKYSYI